MIRPSEEELAWEPKNRNLAPAPTTLYWHLYLGTGIATVGTLVFTALLIALLIVAGAATAVGGSLILASKRRRALLGGDRKQLTTGSTRDLVERGFSDLRVDDIVQYSGQDFLVEGVIRYDEAGHQWSMAHIVDGKDHQWLLVGLERTGSASKRLLQPTSEIDMNGYPSELLVVGDERFSFDKRGTATTSLDGNTGSLGGSSASKGGSVHRCRWWNYQAPGDKTLLVEQWGDDYRVLIGRSVGDTDLEMMPGS